MLSKSTNLGLVEVLGIVKNTKNDLAIYSHVKGIKVFLQESQKEVTLYKTAQNYVFSDSTVESELFLLIKEVETKKLHLKIITI